MKNLEQTTIYNGINTGMCGKDMCCSMSFCCLSLSEII